MIIKKKLTLRIYEKGLYMDLFSCIVCTENEFKTSFTNVIDLHLNNIEKDKTIICHNHPPLFGIVSNCEYCKVYGNILENGQIGIQQTDILNYLIQDE